MCRHAILFTASALLAVGQALAQSPPTPPVAPPPAEADKKADPLQPQKAEQEPRPASQELQKAASQGGPGAPVAALADPKKWDVSARHAPGRDVPIDTRSGTWMSLDVSPDGSEIAFDLLGDIYVIPMGGGEARAITSGHAWDMQPRYSPAGNEIAFTSDRGGGDNIWVMGRDGSGPRAIASRSGSSSRQAPLTVQARWSACRRRTEAD